MGDFPIWERLYQVIKMRDEQCFRMYQSDFNYMETIAGILVSMRGQGIAVDHEEFVWHHIIDKQLELVAENKKRILGRDE